MAGYRIPDEHMYQGMVMMGITEPDVISKIPDFEATDGDVIIMTYPKAGSTWMAYVTWLVSHNGQDIDKPLHERVRFLETKLNGVHSGLDLLKDDPRPAIMKSHLPAGMFKKQLEERRLKFIIVIRNPKDTLVSLYNFYKMTRPLGNFTGTFTEFFELYESKHLLYGDYFDWYDSWMPYLDLPNVLFVSYEDMKFKMTEVVSRLSKFLDKEMPNPELAQAIEVQTSFEQMENNKRTNYEGAPLFNFEISKFMRKGKVGDWKNYFTTEQSELVDTHYKARLESKGITLKFENEDNQHQECDFAL